MTTDNNDGMDWFERVWAHREDAVYSELFGAAEGETIYTLSKEIFARFGVKDVHPTWLNHGVLVYPPNQRRASWAFVTSGLSNAWDDDEPNPDGPSGLGIELMLESAERRGWAMNVTMNLLALTLLTAAGSFPGRQPIRLYDRVGLGGSILKDGDSKLTYVLAAPSQAAPDPLRLESGEMQILELVGITESEAEFAREEGGFALLEKLRDAGAYPVTDPDRQSVV